MVPLSKIIIREKGDTKDSRGLYVICRSRVEPEMYEVVCQSSEQRKTWAAVIREAGRSCIDDGTCCEKMMPGTLYHCHYVCTIRQANRSCVSGAMYHIPVLKCTSKRLVTRQLHTIFLAQP